MKNLIFGIVGCSGSGKSYIVNYVKNNFDLDVISILLQDNYYKEEYFIVESPNWQCVAFNRKLLKKYILQDEFFRQDLWPDDIAHQFMLKGYYHLALTDLLVSHDHTLKEGINLKIDQGFLRNKDSHIRFKEKYIFIVFFFYCFISFFSTWPIYLNIKFSTNIIII